MENMTTNIERCDCDTPLRKAFTEELTKVVQEITKKYNLELTVAPHNPYVLAFRGCLKKEEMVENLEVVMMLSGDIQLASRLAMLGVDAHKVLANADQIYKSFDLAEVISRESVIKASEEPHTCPDNVIIK